MRAKPLLPLLLGMVLCVPSLASTATNGFLDVSLNGKSTNAVAYVLVAADGHVFMSRADVAALPVRIDMPIAGDMVDLAAVGLTASIDTSTNEVRIEAPPTMFAGGAVNVSGEQAAQVLIVVPGAYANYEVQATHDAHGSAGAIGLDAATFGSWGFLGATAAASIAGGRTTATLLDAAYIWDNPRERTTFLVGDAATSAGVTGQSVRFGGIAYRRNWSLDPTYVTTPTPSFHGEAKLPTTIDVLLDGRPVVNNVEVPAGPWSVTNLPVVSSNGTLQLVARDALGNETMISQQFYIAPRVLKKDLSEFSYELGAARRDYGLRSFGYSTAVAAGTHRLGLTDMVTVESHAEATERQAAVGAGAVANLWNRAVGNVYAGASHADAGSGFLLGYGLQSQGKMVTASLAQAYRSHEYEGLGDALSPHSVVAHPRLLTAAQLTLGSMPSLPRTTFSLTAAAKSRWNAPSQSFLGFSATTTIAGVTFSGSIFSSRGGNPGTSGTGAMLSISVPFEKTAIASASAQQQGKTWQATASYQQPLPTDDGYGYAVRGSHLCGQVTCTQSVFATGAMQDRWGQRGIEVTSNRDATAERLWANGSIGVVDSTWFAARRQDGAFAVVDTGHAPGIEVYREHNPISTTNPDGRAVITGLRGYEPVKLSIDPAQVPFGYRLGQTEILATPQTRGAVRVAFDLQRERGAIVVLHQPDGSPVPAGAVVKLAGSDTETVVGRRGEAYLDNTPEAADLTVRYRGQQCRVHSDVPAGDDPQPRIGPLTCALAKEAP